MRKLALAFLGAACVASMGCAYNRNIQNQLDATNINFNRAKKGMDCAYFALGIFPLTKTDIDVAAKKAHIRSLKYVETYYANYILFSKKCIVTYGE
ncbi:MAG TPA: TRL-like family protein [Candidatus Avelusimicrobium excrementipullorum]|nr:TRL-like family protein [Candidatus Avelusimicrobium excrementipullorum]